MTTPQKTHDEQSAGPRKLGDFVWIPKSDWTRIWETCPDCLGTAHWRCVLPSGEEFECECPRCYPGGLSCSTGKIGERYEFVERAEFVEITGMEQCGSELEYSTTGGCGLKSWELFDDEQSAKSLARGRWITFEQIITRNNAILRQEVEFKKMKAMCQSKGRPKKNAYGEPQRDDCPGRSSRYAGSQIRRAMEEAVRWIEYAERSGTTIPKHKIPGYTITITKDEES